MHFISGLPRSGSTLLSSLLRQNPRMHAGMTSPVSHLVNAVLRETSMRHEDAVFIDDDIRKALVRGVFDVYYKDVAPGDVVFDTSRGWTTKMAVLSELYPAFRMICCVRNPAWIIDSIETITQKHPFELSGIFSFEPGGTIYSRSEALAGPKGMMGYALNALREGIYSKHKSRIMLVRYESLVRDTRAVLEQIYDFIDEPYFEGHDPTNIPPSYDMMEFDRRLGTPGLHDVGDRVVHIPRKTILPPDLFARFEEAAFWEEAEFQISELITA
ncbi:sulfotransferase [Epibacterium sp. SM1969]|uniref:Sulfotransferase n=2 Tax=Tritonibacter aquimaris TaxID=2663379 RepID=A0A844AP98_9RHOB|nr:sulfotransferase [Tritonibacter aquimaris]